MVTYLTGLTTAWIRPSSCSSHWTYEASLYNGVFGGVLMQNVLGDPQDTDCLPSGYNDYGRIPARTAVYSPGICPYGYTTAANPSIGSVTTAICCLSSFSYYQTYSTAGNGVGSFTYEGCLSTYPQDNPATTVTARSGQFGLNGTVVSGQITMWAQPVTVAMRQADLTLFTTSTSSLAVPSSTTSIMAQTSNTVRSDTSIVITTPASVVTTSPTPSGAVTTTNSSLSGGAIAGIAIGGVAVFAIIAGLAIFFGLRKRSDRSQPAAVDASYSAVPQLDPPVYAKMELSGTPVYEAPVQHAKQPMVVSQTPPTELA